MGGNSSTCNNMVSSANEMSNGTNNSSSVFTVVKCGASGHNIRSDPNLKAPPVGMLVLGNNVVINNVLKNDEG